MMGGHDNLVAKANGQPQDMQPRSAPSDSHITKPNLKKKSRRATEPSNQKRRCISTACIACRKRKSKCDGALPSCAACASVYGTDCIYDPNSDHRRKGVYREKVDSMKARSSTLQTLVEAILNAPDDEVAEIVGKIRTGDNLDDVAEQILQPPPEINDASYEQAEDDYLALLPMEGERDLARKMGELRIENGTVRFIGGTSNLIYLGDPYQQVDIDAVPGLDGPHLSNENKATSWTAVSCDAGLISHLMNLYFTYHYPAFTILSRKLFWRDFMKGRTGVNPSRAHCSPLLVNAMLALGCHLTDAPAAYAHPSDNRTKGDHFFAEAKRLILDNDEYAKPRLPTIQALALMSVREAGCAREAKGWVYSGMSFRMAQDIGLNLELASSDKQHLDEDEVDARRVTAWGCFLVDKCWSNYMGRLPQLPRDSFNMSKFDVFPDEDAAMWSPYGDRGFDESQQQPARTRAVALQEAKLCEISSDLLVFFYHPTQISKPTSRSVQLKKLSELHQRLEEWRRKLPREFEPKDGQLPNVILMHMFFHLQYIHLFRPFLKYDPSSSPLPSHVSPRRICTANAGAISKLMRLYKKTYNLRRICNIAVYMTHSACTIHLLNLPEKTARRDITHGVRHLEEISEDWLSARRTLNILSVLARKWNCELPGEAAFVLQRADEKYGRYSPSAVPSPVSGATTSSRVSEDGSISVPRSQQGDYSPLTQYTPAHLSQIRQPSLDRINIASALQGMSGAQMAQAAAMMPMENTQLDYSTDIQGGWNSPTTTAPGSGYASPFSMIPRAAIPQGGTPQSTTRQVSPGQPMTMDSQEWLLSEGVRWHRHFGGWDINPETLEGSNFMYDGNRRNSNMSVQSEGTNMRFEGLQQSLESGGWLPGLE